MEPYSFYFWKWADNDLPGPPVEVHAALLRGEIPPALQPFDAGPLLESLERMAGRGQGLGEAWTWDVVPAGQPQRANFVFVTTPRINAYEERTKRFTQETFRLDVSGIDEDSGDLIPWLLPKRNRFICPQHPAGQLYDIDPGDLRSLIRALDRHTPDPFCILEDRRSRYVQCRPRGRRFAVEWRDQHDPPIGASYDHWHAQDRARLAALNGPYEEKCPPEKDADFLLFADALRIFEAFIRGEPRPDRYHWRSVNHWFKKK